MKKGWIIALAIVLLLPAAGWLAYSLLPEPPYTQLNNTEFSAAMQQGIPIIDIRRPEEWRATGVVEGSYLVTAFDERGRMLQDFPDLFSQIISDPEQPVILICRTGNRTEALSRILAEQAGYAGIHNVTHGIVSWMAAGGAVQPCPQRGPDLRC